MQTRKDFDVTINVDGVEKTIKGYVVRPTNEIVKASDRHRAKVWNQCLIEGVLTKKELEKVLKDRGIFDEAKLTEEKEISQSIQELERKLYRGDGSGKKMKLSEGKSIAVEMRRLRARLRNLIAERISFEQNTAETLSDDAKFDFMVAACSYREDGSKAYSGIDDYNQKSSDEFSFVAASALAEMLYQIDPKIEESLPENKWLKQFNLVDDNLNLVKDGVLVDSTGRRINEFGHYIDENGNRVDIDGNPLDEFGNYVLSVQYESDEAPVAKKKK